jgi:transglutaminase-like putative cysteine protease
VNAATAWIPRWPGWRHLPREARDTIFQLGVIGWIVAPHLLERPWWCAVLVAGILLWRLRLVVAGAPLPGRWAVTALLAVAVALTWRSEGTLLGKEAGVTMLVVLMALKTLELRARRDALVVFFLGFFLVLTHYLYSQSLPTALGTLVAVWGLLTALVLSQMPIGRPSIAQAGAVAARTALLGLPLMLALFVLFPRIGPLWGLPEDAAGRTGLSGTMRMGGVASLANDDSIAMRVRFVGNVPPPTALYFRGPVLSPFDGLEWSRQPLRTPAPPRLRADVQTLGAPVRYELTIEPSRLSMLPLLELTPDRPDALPVLSNPAEDLGLTLRADLQWQTQRPVTDRIRVEALAWPIYRHGPRTMGVDVREHLQLPPGYNPRTLQWAAELRARPDLADADASTLAAAVLAHIGRADFTYTLEPGAYGRHAVDEFWLDRKLGFCEHFSAAFVVIMRAMGVPARIVTGYQGTDPDPVDGYYIVRQRHAHAWAEYWQAGEGWVRADPTASVAPERIQRSRSLQAPPNLVAQAIGRVSPQLLQRWRTAWERLDNRWNQWVLNYSRGQQFDLMRRLGLSAPDWRDLAMALIGVLCTVSLAGASWALWDRQRQPAWMRLQGRIERELRRLGVQVAPHDGPRTRGERTLQVHGAAAAGLAARLQALERARYGAGAAAPSMRAWWRDFAAEAARLRARRPARA